MKAAATATASPIGTDCVPDIVPGAVGSAVAVFALSSHVHPVSVHPGGAPALGGIVRVDGAAAVFSVLVDEGKHADAVRLGTANRSAA